MSYENSTVVYSNPGNGEVFNAVHGLHTFAGQGFNALESSLTEVSLWFVEGNNDSVRVDILSGNIYSGKILSTKLLPPGSSGKRTVTFSDPVYLEKGASYFLRVSSGAPGTKTGTVAKGMQSDENSEKRGYKNTAKAGCNMAVELVFKAWEGALPEKEEQMLLEPGYEESVNYALSQSRDVWGEELINLPEGPTYDNIKGYLKPLMLCGTFLTDSGIYYLHFGRPEGPSGGGPVALHVADGSQIISTYYNKDKTTIFVGKTGKERYGASLKRLKAPVLEEGYLPVLKTSYKDSCGVNYEQESFSDYIAETSSLVSFVKLTVINSGKENIKTQVRFHISDESLILQDSDQINKQNTLDDKLTREISSRLVKDNNVYIVFSGKPVYISPNLIYELDLQALSVKTIYIAKLQQPSACAQFTLDENKYENVKTGMINYWNNRLSEGAAFIVPEEQVMKAAKNLLIQNLYMGWRYSVGNAYETFYNPESSDMAATLGMYGYLEEQKETLCALIDMLKPGRAYPNWEWGEKLSHAAQYYFMTLDGSLISENKEKYENIIHKIKAQMEGNEDGLLNKQNFSGDIEAPSYYLHHQAVVWRGLHDMSEVWKALNDVELHKVCLDCASKLRAALINAIEKSEVKLEDGTLFIPSEVLSSKTQVFDPITSTKYGSYWNLCISYALTSGLLDYKSERMKNLYEYFKKHGAWLLGMVRFNYYPVEIGGYIEDGLAGYKTPGVDNVYGLAHAQLISEMDDADRLVLAFYAKLAHGMTRETYISGEGDTIGVCPGEYCRSVYLPPSGANNSLFLKILRLMLIRETTDLDCRPDGLCIAYATPRGWLEHGKTIVVKDAPTLFGPISYNIDSFMNEDYINIKLQIPSRNTMNSLSLRLRTPGKKVIKSVIVDGKEHNLFNAVDETIDLTGTNGEVEIKVNY